MKLINDSGCDVVDTIAKCAVVPQIQGQRMPQYTKKDIVGAIMIRFLLSLPLAKIGSDSTTEEKTVFSCHCIRLSLSLPFDRITKVLSTYNK